MICSVAGCFAKVHRMNMCAMHCERVRVHGCVEPELPSVVGRIYGSFVVRRRVGTDKHGFAVVQALCDCGNTVALSMAKLYDPKMQKHCGCRDGSDGKCIKAPASSYGRWCKCKVCHSARAAARKQQVRKAKARARELAALPDEVAIQRAVRGERPQNMTKPELMEAFRVLYADGLSAANIAERLKVSERTIERYKKREAT